jgi:hypothetical protein
VNTTSTIVLWSAIGGLLIYLIIAIFLALIFRKAGIPAWAGFVPVYSTWKFFQLGGFAGWWAILYVLPIVNIVATIVLFVAEYRVAKRFGKSGWFVLWGILFPFVYFGILALDSSELGPLESGGVRTPEVAQA